MGSETAPLLMNTASQDNSITVDGQYYYRLKQVDFNGSYSYSDIINVNFVSPDNFNLEQNYPNPFNPDTKIKYSLPSESNVKLIVYNSLGEIVKTLISKMQSAGSYEIRFDASGLSSGIYICSLQVNSSDGKQIFHSSKKMSLLK